MLEIRDLWFSYSKGYVLKGINVKLRKGVGCLLGPNGVGKTTLLKCVCGALRPAKGEVLLDGRDVLKLSYVDRAKLVSYVPQELSLRFPYTVLSVVLMGRTPHLNILAGPKEGDVKAALEALELLNIKHLARKPFTSLSGGEKRLALIARALAQESKLLLLDEPTSFLDFRNMHLVLSIVKETVRSTGRVALMTLHDPNIACMYCDEVFIMKDGRVVNSGPPQDVVTEDAISRVYGLTVRVVRVNGHKVILPQRPICGERVETCLHR